jgi:hypothetical protein
VIDTIHDFDESTSNRDVPRSQTQTHTHIVTWGNQKEGSRSEGKDAETTAQEKPNRGYKIYLYFMTISGRLSLTRASLDDSISNASV